LAHLSDQKTPLHRGYPKVTTTPCGDKEIFQKSYANDIPCHFRAKIVAVESVSRVVRRGKKCPVNKSTKCDVSQFLGYTKLHQAVPFSQTGQDRAKPDFRAESPTA
jgi:hypothetical protein